MKGKKLTFAEISRYSLLIWLISVKKDNIHNEQKRWSPFLGRLLKQSAYSFILNLKVQIVDVMAKIVVSYLLFPAK